jgi:hypothetical protein
VQGHVVLGLPALGVRVDLVEPLGSEQVPLRQRRPLIRAMGFGGDDVDLPVEAPLAQLLRGGRRREPSPDDDDTHIRTLFPDGCGLTVRL